MITDEDKKHTFLNICFSPEQKPLLAEITKYAKDHYKSVSAGVRIMLTEYLRQKGNAKA